MPEQTAQILEEMVLGSLDNGGGEQDSRTKRANHADASHQARGDQEKQPGGVGRALAFKIVA